MYIKNKKITVLGLGKTGLAAANLYSELGAKVFVSEARDEKDAAESLGRLDRKVKYETGGHTDRVLEADFIVKSPGISQVIPVLGAAAKKGVKVYSELEVSFGLINPDMLIAITGTNGKTTTTTLVDRILAAAGRKSFAAGNIDQPLSSYVHRIDRETCVVLEVSSYQLENTEKFRPDIACIVNITPDHLEHHGSMENYMDAKKNIYRNQSPRDNCIFNIDNELCMKMSHDCPSGRFFFSSGGRIRENGVYYEDGSFHINLPGARSSIKPAIKIPGMHNVENVLASVCMATLCGIDPKVTEKAVSEFSGVEHRLEFVRDVNGARYINDSKSTNVDSTAVALKAVSAPVLLIMGGRHKGSSYKPLERFVREKVRGLFLIGEASAEIAADLKGSTEIYMACDLKSAVNDAHGRTEKGDTVLLSPGCSSFDQFRNFEQRGKVFKEFVRKLK